MAAGVVKLADVVVPEIFNPYMQNITTQKTRIVTSGAVILDETLSEALNGPALTFKTPSFKDLDDEAEDIMSDDYDDVYGATFGTPDNFAQNKNSYPAKTGSLTEISVRLSRHKSWSSAQLASVLAGSSTPRQRFDPMAALANRVGYYWARRRQAAFISTVTGLFADNDAAPDAGGTHIQFDLTYNAGAGGVFQQGVTEFSTANFLRALLTMGDSQDDLGMVLMHSVVFHKAQLNNLIEFVPDAVNPNVADIPFFLGRRVIVDDQMTVDGTGKIFDTWMFGSGAFRMGVGSPEMPSEVERAPRAGKGAGQDILHSRVSWCIHPVGYKYAVASPAAGGPDNTTTSGNLGNLASWVRVYPERKQIKIARLKTIEIP
jgi:hypothetical protein